MRTNTDINVVSFSGGRTSAYLVYLMEQKRKHEGWDVHYIFMDTGAEHPKTYEFIRDVAFYFDIDLVCLRLDASTPLGKGNRYDVCSVDEIGPDLKPFTGLVKKYGTPGIGAAHCTREMKSRIFEKYCKDRWGRGEYTSWIGIRADEERRLKRKERVRYLADISPMTKQGILSWWSQQPFDLEIDEHLGNCIFCFKKSQGKLALAIRDCQDEYIDFWSMICDPDNRPPPSGADPQIMYRGSRSLPDIDRDFSEFSRQEIWDSLHFTKKFDTNSCSESCEVFNFDE